MLLFRFCKNVNSGNRKRNPSEMSNPEIALNFEKEHLRSAEECDYMVMENLIQRRYDDDEEMEESADYMSNKNPTLLSVVAETREYRVASWPTRNALRRASAIEGDPPTLQGQYSQFRLALHTFRTGFSINC